MLINRLFETVIPLLPYLGPFAVTHKPDINVVPLPTQYTIGQGATPICLSPNFSIKSVAGAFHTYPTDLLQAMSATEDRLKNVTARYLSVAGGREFFPGYSDKLSSCQYFLDSVYVDLTAYNGTSDILEEATRPVEERPLLEAYSLDMPLKRRAAFIKARGALGAFRGLTTLDNLFYRVEDSTSEGAGRVYAPWAPYSIADKPAFGWRAFLLDTSRHYFSVDSILKTLDTMASVKLNVFHWHVTDSNSWPLDIPAYPNLAKKGAYSPLEVYSDEDVRNIIEYAGHHGIDTLLEIDTPGHTASIYPSHPSHVACFESTPFHQYAHQPPAGQLRFASEQVMKWTEGLLREVSALASSQYLSTGGDEINVDCMLKDGPTARDLKNNDWTLDDALDRFTAVTHAPIRAAGKTPVVWQEMVLDHGEMPSLGNDTIVDIWVNSADARKVLNKGFRIVHASADYFYLDCGQGGWIGQEGGGNSWCDPLKSWAKIYSFDPFLDVEDDERHLVLGGQTSLWAEQTDETNLEPTIWPRAAALAEVFWSGPGPDGRPRSTISALPRMHDVRYRMVSRGVRAAPLQPHWCALRPGACVFGG
ncbi:hexosaminidase [Cryptococcus wingfieldii CBS 7118]|uniref:Beta-hexosaminidase n=1 Tax=Cryptococcus wingfieldii CBS 7118 TaxID=1295528 RepID=A0A1E3IS27_9TREE|nr:hexosaminidase [Cryptococcus wingfieldii CBS 7118]ODN91414.1 hexosaminidase [Cryptococcus wingfieldii CBS 7118]